MIGHLQRNKVKRAMYVFDMIETVDSLRLAQAMDRQCAEIGKKMSVLIEINSGREQNKSGVLPEDIDELVANMSTFKNLQLQGLMTMGPLFGDPENARPYFKVTKTAFDRLADANISNIEMRFLSMGMSNNYHIAIEEGANLVRIGTKLFGERHNSRRHNQDL
jgi:pyridoxal phosphate enzyme (YggS family)